MSDQKYMSQRQYAKHRGVLLSAVVKALAAGRISTSITPKGLKRIDWKKCDKDWEDNTDVSNVSPKSIEDLPENKNVPDDPSIPVFAKSRALKEAYNARIKKLEYEERKSKLVQKDVVQKAIVNIAFSVKEQLRTIPQKMAPDLAADNDSRSVEIKLLKEIDQALSSLDGLKDAF